MNLYNNAKPEGGSILLKPYQILALAIELEKSNAYRMSEWADRFLPFDSRVSSGLEALAKELKSGYVDSQELYGMKFGDYCFSLAQEQNHCDVDRFLDAPEKSEHFFILNSGMAKEMLQAIIAVGDKISAFYRQTLKDTRDETLLSNYNKLLKSELKRIRDIRKLQA